MELDLGWLLIGVPVVFALGWVAARLDLRQLRRQRADSPRAYFEGLNLLLNEQADKAIDAFIEAVQADPDTTELHFALGNLFRRRGEFERAVRVHEHLLQRADLKAGDRHRAQRALAQDFMQAGLFDRAEQAWALLLDSPHDAQARLALLTLAERSRDWPRALELARALEAAGDAGYASRIAHYECELAEAADAQGRPDDAAAAVQRARAAAPHSPRPLLLAGQRAARQGRPGEALAAWDALRAEHPAAFLLVAEDYAAAARAAGRQEAARATLQAQLQQQPAVELLLALDRLEGDAGPAEARLARRRVQLQRQPTLSSSLLVLDEPHRSWPDEVQPALRDAVARAARPLQRYRCASCAFEAQHHFWQCPGCLNWDSYPPQRIDAL
ncbi:MAG: lipopolysaccharide assembly protein LapB [Rubrivivax sp.]|nr:lipopolysaccharide assembly protein LapB [Rubrivivax sp.]